MNVVVVGAGVFGLGAARELAARGHEVRVVEPGPVPHPLAASTDISKVIRMEYGPDEQYAEMAEVSIRRLLELNETLDDEIYHHDGVAMITRDEMVPGGFEYESFQTLERRGHHPVRLRGPELKTRFPAWSSAFTDGFYNPYGGWVESGRLIAALARLARQAGVGMVEDRAVEVKPGRVRLAGGLELECEVVVVAAGAWTPLLVPRLQPYMRSTGHPVFHLQTATPDLFSHPLFSTFTADIARSGWYGFPHHPRERVIKVANHGPGRFVHPDRDAREVYPVDIEGLRAFLAEALPALADARVVYTRRCLYCDTLDEHFWIAEDPDQPGVFVATGGSGHGMKFAPVLGPLIADAVEGQENGWLARFRWRHLEPDTKGEEPARNHQSPR